MTPAEAAAWFAFATSLIEAAPSIEATVRDVYEGWRAGKRPELRELPPRADEQVVIEIEGQEAVDEKFGMK